MEINREDVISALTTSGSKGLKGKEIARKLGVRSKGLKHLRALLRELESEGEIVRGRRRRYQLPHSAGFTRGTIFGYGLNIAHLLPADGSPDIKVTGEDLNGARHGDLVIARRRRQKDGEVVAQVVRILRRAPSDFIGEVLGRRGRRFVYIDTPTTHTAVKLDRDGDARLGDHVLIRVSGWDTPYEEPRGSVSEILGGRFTPGEDFARIVKEFNLPLAFPQPCLDEVEAIPETIPDEELDRREDLRHLPAFTIDPEDARDFDDAISIQKLGAGMLRVGVHIADVSHYVSHGSFLDHEACARGRSVYLVDRAIPMLPARLSSDVAALRPGRPRLAVSVIMDVTRRGEVSSYRIKETVTTSRARLTYHEAQQMIDKGPGWRGRKAEKEIADALRVADGLRATLRERRIRKGAIELETPELDIEIDGSGNTVGVKPAKRLSSHSLIEELMILANETVANHMAYLGRSFVYRVHEVPDAEAMMDLSLFAATFGHRFRWTRGTSPRALQTLLRKIRGRPEEYLISMFLLRSLKKAQYSERNVGHFGLASKCYTHFTSPIRRYPDLVVHRLLKIYGLYRTSPENEDALRKFVSRISDIASIREVEGDQAERASVKARVAEFMERKIGEEYWGVVSGTTDFGFFVMLENTLVEGLVHVSSLGDDYYSLDSTGTILIGSRGGHYYRMGDRVRVRVSRVDRERREVDFEVLAKEEGEHPVDVDAAGRSRRRKLYKEVQQEVKRARSAGRRRGGLKRPRRATRSVKTKRLRRLR